MSSGPQKKLPTIGITIGDLNGIGPEIIIKAFADDRFHNLCRPIIYASAQTLIYHKKLINNKHFNFNVVDSAADAQYKKINVVNAWSEEVKIEIGEPSNSTGKAALASIKAAMADHKEGLLDAIVTAPINKKTVQQAGMDFPGHTEFFASQFNSEHYLMLLVGERMKVAVVTGHIPLSEVSEELSKKKVLKAIKALNRSLTEDFSKERPSIAVLGLNPHAGENGTMGDDEEESIQPAMEEAKRQGINVQGPYPSDGFFGTGMYHNFDAVLAMYHDQGLIPFKLLEFDNGVNYTAGLPLIRTSPDHGTAYSIAGKNAANPQSMIEAIYLALNIQRSRLVHEEITANPLGTKMEKQKDRE